MPNKIIITPGDKIHFWTVIGESDIKSKQNKRQLVAKCACGTEKLLDARSLYGTGRRISQSCGCKKGELITEKSKDVVEKGTKYNRLTILKEVESEHAPNCNKTYRRVCCECVCGDVRDYYYHAVKSGKTSSCGCYIREVTGNRSRTHGMKGTPTYHTWRCMRSRCKNPNDQDYKYYGGRGISVCKRWDESFENFIEDMGERPENKTLDRIDSNKNYEPENCRWATAKEQARNKRDTVKITYKGKVYPLAHWVDIFGINYSTLWSKCKNANWIADEVFDELLDF